MSANSLKGQIQEILSQAEIQINGSQPWDMTVHDERFYARVLREGSMGLGESYMDGWWDCLELDQFFSRLFRAGVERHGARSWRGIALVLKSLLFNLQTKTRSVEVAKKHYDLGNEVFQAMLDRRMVYTCGRWEHARDLNEAQEAKLDFVCRKLQLAPGMRVLDIGCGWGSFARFTAEKYGAEVVGITLSRQQLELGRILCADLPVELRLEDYRNLSGSFDSAVSLGMFEHVGSKNYRTFFEVARRAVGKKGRLFLSTIGSNRTVRTTDPWIERYIFPNSHLPSIPQIGRAIAGLFVIDELLNWGPDYDQTLMAWSHNFESNWDRFRERYGERFYRMWRYYLLASAASFRSRRLQVWQILLSPATVVR